MKTENVFQIFKEFHSSLIKGQSPHSQAFLILVYKQALVHHQISFLKLIALSVHWVKLIKMVLVHSIKMALVHSIKTNKSTRTNQLVRFAEHQFAVWVRSVKTEDVWLWFHKTSHQDQEHRHQLLIVHCVQLTLLALTTFVIHHEILNDAYCHFILLNTYLSN